MSETETIELERKEGENLIDLLKAGPRKVGQVLSVKRRCDIAGQLREQLSHPPNIIALCGLPGAGKSHTAEKLGQVYDTEVVSMGDAIREEFRERKGREHESGDELGEFAAEWREEAPEEIPEKVMEIASRVEPDPVVVEGVRSLTDYQVLSDYSDTLHLIEVVAEFYTRLERLQERGREGEADFDAVDLAERDERERNDLGFGALEKDEQIDFALSNKQNDTLAITLSNIVENNLPYDIEDGRPLGLDDELEKIRKRC